MMRPTVVLLVAAAGLVSVTTLTPAEEAAARGRTFIGGPAVASTGTPTGTPTGTSSVDTQRAVDRTAADRALGPPAAR